MIGHLPIAVYALMLVCAYFGLLRKRSVNPQSVQTGGIRPTIAVGMAIAVIFFIIFVFIFNLIFSLRFIFFHFVFFFLFCLEQQEQ